MQGVPPGNMPSDGTDVEQASDATQKLPQNLAPSGGQGPDAPSQLLGNSGAEEEEGVLHSNSAETQLSPVQRRLRERRLKLEAELRREIEDEQRRRKQREEEHKARLIRLEKYRRNPHRIYRREQQQRDERPEEEVPVIRSPPIPRPSSASRAAAKAAQIRSKMRLRLRKEAEDRQKEEESRREQARSEHQVQAMEAHRRIKARVRKVEKAKHEHKKAMAEAEAQEKEEARGREAEAREIAQRRARRRLKKRSSNQKHEEEERSLKLAAQLKVKRERAAAQAEALPRVRAMAGMRARQYLGQKHLDQEFHRRRTEEQKRQRQEAKRQYCNPEAIAQLKQNVILAKDQEKLASEVAHNAVGEAVVSVSTDFCSTGELQVEFDDDDFFDEPSVVLEQDAADAGAGAPSSSAYTVEVASVIVENVLSIAQRNDEEQKVDRPSTVEELQAALPPVANAVLKEETDGTEAKEASPTGAERSNSIVAELPQVAMAVPPSPESIPMPVLESAANTGDVSRSLKEASVVPPCAPVDRAATPLSGREEPQLHSVQAEGGVESNGTALPAIEVGDNAAANGAAVAEQPPLELPVIGAPQVSPPIATVEVSQPTVVETSLPPIEASQQLSPCAPTANLFDQEALTVAKTVPVSEARHSEKEEGMFLTAAEDEGVITEH